MLTNSDLVWKVSDLRVEHRVSPGAVDSPTPRLSWRVAAAAPNAQNQAQSSYHLLVASRPDWCTPERADLWNSGVVASRATLAKFAGRLPKPGSSAFWRVRSWNQDQIASSWSEVSSWVAGLTRPEDWKAEWIGDTIGAEASKFSFGKARWVAPRGTKLGENLPPGDWAAISSFDLSSDAQVAILTTADDSLKLQIDGAEVLRTSGPEAWRTPASKLVALKSGRHAIRATVSNGPNPSPSGLLLRVEWPGGELLSGPKWTIDGQPAEDLGLPGPAPWGTISASQVPAGPAPMLRHEFVVRPGLRSATLFASAMGLLELRLNGARVGEDLLEPGYTRFDLRTLYVTHDVTRQVREGGNALGVVLGNGFLNVPTPDAWNFETAHWKRRPQALVQLRLEYDDGSAELVTSDRRWRWAPGPITWDAIRQGERYDARLEVPGWDTPAFDGSAWKPVETREGPRTVSASKSHPVRVAFRFPNQAGRGVHDMGFGFSGRETVSGSANPGSKITIRHAEKIHEDGSLDAANIDGLVFGKPFQTDEFVVGPSGSFQYSPSFVYHGSRFVEVSASDPDAQVSVGAEFFHDAFPAAGGFECSNDLLNWFHEATLRSYESNFVSIPTDCPHREKNGWMGDAHLASELGLWNFANQPGYEKWLDDLMDEQRPSGELPGIVPTPGWGYQWGNGPAWDSALLVIPWNLYLMSGDPEPLARTWPAMRRYVDYLATKWPDRIVRYGLGDWVPHKTETPIQITSTAFFYRDATILASAAEVLGRDEAERYRALAQEIRSAFRAHFVGAFGFPEPETQTSMACALEFGMLEDWEKPAVTQKLADAAREELDVGLLGASWIFRALAENGQFETAYELATRTSYPSFGWWREKGATNLWETWSGDASRNHIMFGDLDAWFYRELCGIRPIEPGFTHFELRPQIPAALERASAWHDAPGGRIESSWKRTGRRFEWRVRIPANSTADVFVPTSNPSTVREGGRVLESATPLRLGSGVYHFESEL